MKLSRKKLTFIKNSFPKVIWANIEDPRFNTLNSEGIKACLEHLIHTAPKGGKNIKEDAYAYEDFYIELHNYLARSGTPENLRANIWNWCTAIPAQMVEIATTGEHSSCRELRKQIEKVSI